MELKDLIVTPIYLFIFTLIAYAIRPKLTSHDTKKYFIPALWARFGGALFLGGLYQFYYGGGDTFGFFLQSKVIHSAVLENPAIGLKLLFTDGLQHEELLNYSSRIYWYGANSEFFLVQVVGFFSLLTLSTYSSIALYFAFFSFLGSWFMFDVLQKTYKSIASKLAIGVLFIPSCIFWGSGVLKDTVTLSALGFLFWSVFQLVTNRKFSIKILTLLVVSGWIIFSVKIYVLICFIPAAFIWWYLQNISLIKSGMVRIMIAPFLLLLIVGFGYYLVSTIASTSDKYNLASIAEWSYITAYDIGFFTGKDAGSGYNIGSQDGTWENLIKLIPSAINVSLFRPYLWEVRNPLMLFSALESVVILSLTVRIILLLFRQKIRKRLNDPLVISFLVFSLTFAFAVGVSTYNFGSLSRYKIPMLPFYLSALIILLCSKKDRLHKLSRRS